MPIWANTSNMTTLPIKTLYEANRVLTGQIKTMKELVKKLLLVQEELGAVTKDKENPFFKSSYADINSYIDAIKPALNKHKLVILQPLTTDGVMTMLIDTETGEDFRFTMKLPELADPQKMGSAITYFRRYSLQSLFVLKAEDDDANSTKDKSPF